jgi:hypothetical protein
VIAEESIVPESSSQAESISVRIVLGEPWVVSEGERQPLSALQQLGSDAELRSSLRILINGRPLPALEKWNAEGVCLATWLSVLRDTARVVGGGDCIYIFDEGAPGKPRFVFRREGDALLVSVNASELSGAEGYAEWHQEACCARGFVNQVSKLFVDFERTLGEAAPQAGPTWLERRVYDQA